MDSTGSIPGGSTSSALLGGNGGGLEEDGVLKLEDEKPLMMIGIADYPSLGFKEDLVGATPTPDINFLSSLLGLDKLGLSVNDERKYCAWHVLCCQCSHWLCGFTYSRLIHEF